MRLIKTTGTILATSLLASSAGGIAAQEDGREPTTPARVTGTIALKRAQVESPTVTPHATGTEIRGWGFAGDVFQTDDPWLNGTATIVINEDQWRGGLDGGISLQAFNLTIESVDGAWQGEGTAVVHATQFGELMNLDTVILAGEEGFEGHTAYLVLDLTSEPATVEGVIVEGELPQFPEVPSAKATK